MALMDDLAELFELAGLGSVSARSLVAGILPDDPDQVIALLSYGGPPPQRNQSQRAIHSPRVQVRVRSPLYQVCEGLAQRAAGEFPRTNEYIAGTKYLSIDLLGEPAFLRRDEHDRVEFVFNLQIFHGGA